MKAIDKRNSVSIFILDATNEEINDIYDECLDMIMDGVIKFESYAGVMPDTRSAVIELQDDAESYTIRHDHTGVTLEIVSRNYIMMHDIETANEVRVLI